MLVGTLFFFANCFVLWNVTTMLFIQSLSSKITRRDVYQWSSVLCTYKINLFHSKRFIFPYFKKIFNPHIKINTTQDCFPNMKSQKCTWKNIHRKYLHWMQTLSLIPNTLHCDYMHTFHRIQAKLNLIEGFCPSRFP